LGGVAATTALYLLGYQPFYFEVLQWPIILIVLLALIGYKVRQLRPTRDEAVVISGLSLVVAGIVCVVIFIGVSFISGLVSENP
jgi:hypothetical protein